MGGAGACGQRSRAPPPQPPAWAGRGRRAERRARSAKVRRRRGAGGVDRERRLWEARSAVPRGAAVGGWREGFPRMERTGSCAQAGKMGPEGACGVGVRVTVVLAFRCLEREFGADRICPAKVSLCPRKTKGVRGVSFGSSELCSGSWILSLEREGRWPWVLLFSPASPIC